MKRSLVFALIILLGVTVIANLPPAHAVQITTFYVTGSGSITFESCNTLGVSSCDPPNQWYNLGTYSNGQTYASSGFSSSYLLRFTANPSGSQFQSWSTSSGVTISTNNPTLGHITTSSDVWVRATFQQSVNYYSVNLNVSPSVSAGGITLSGTTYTNMAVSLTAGSYSISAFINPGYTFTSWSVSGSVSVASTTASSTTLTVNGAGTLTANFQQIVTTTAQTAPTTTASQMRTVNIYASPSNGGSITIDGITKQPGTSISLSTGTHSIAANPNTNFAIAPSAWAIAGSVTAVDRTTSPAIMTISGDGGGSITANFVAAFDFSSPTFSGGITAVQGQSGSNTLTVTLINSPSQAVTLSCISSSLPSGSSCVFSQQVGSPTFTSTLTVVTSVSTPVNLYTVTVQASGGGKTHTGSFTLTITESAVSPAGAVRVEGCDHTFYILTSDSNIQTCSPIYFEVTITQNSASVSGVQVNWGSIGNANNYMPLTKGFVPDGSTFPNDSNKWYGKLPLTAGQSYEVEVRVIWSGGSTQILSIVGGLSMPLSSIFPSWSYPIIIGLIVIGAFGGLVALPLFLKKH